MTIKFSGGSLKPYGDGRYRGQVMYIDEKGNRRNRTRVFNMGKREASKAFEAWKMELEANVEREIVRSDKKLAVYLDDCITRQLALGNVERSTIVGYRTLVNIINESIGDIPLSGLIPSDVERLLADILDSGKSPNTARKCLARLKYYLNLALEDGLIEKNPCDRIAPPKARKPERVAMSAQGRSELLKHLQGMEDTPLTLSLLLALYTGMRQGEICALRWSDIDLTSDGVAFIHVKKAIGQDIDGSYYLKEPKSTASIRDIPLVDQGVIDRLRRVRAGRQEECIQLGISLQEAPYVIGSIDGQFMVPDTLQKRFRALRDVLSLKNAEGRPLQFHELRHTYATEAIAAGVDIEAAASILGHGKPSVTLDIYGSARPESKMKAAHVIAEVYSKAPAVSPILPLRPASGGSK